MAGFSQRSLTKIIVDAKTKLPIDYVYISSTDKKINLLSTKDGGFILIDDGKAVAFSFYKIGYLKKTISIAELLKRDTVFLTEDILSLNEITVTAKIIDTIVKNKRFYVDDYLVLPNNDFLLITTRINKKGFEVVYYKKDIGITCTKKFKNEGGEHLFFDCFKNIHLVTNGFSRQVFFDSDSTFDFLSKYTKARFDSTIALCVLKVDSQVIIKYSPPPTLVQGKFLQNPFFLTYIKLSKNSRLPFYTAMYTKNIREMIKYEIFDEQFMKLSPAAMENFHQLFYSKIAGPIYAPVFLKNDTVVVFNFQENAIVFLNKNGVLLQQVSLNNAQYSSLHDFEVICDKQKQVFYIKTKGYDNASLQRINIYSGEISKGIKLEKIFAKNIQVQNGHIYYLVKEKEWDDTQYLYQQN